MRGSWEGEWWSQAAGPVPRQITWRWGIWLWCPALQSLDHDVSGTTRTSLRNPLLQHAYTFEVVNISNFISPKLQ